ncbi:MAG: hypothetical protein LJE96_10300 [Deltaproteobacteria bacterium]|jgi:hypothetical protein|nr:hypothetical protein [Deltaproteobacteria bacterium]
MEKLQNCQGKVVTEACCCSAESGNKRPMNAKTDKTAESSSKKGWWARYVNRLKKHEGDVRSCCR